MAGLFLGYGSRDPSARAWAGGRMGTTTQRSTRLPNRHHQSLVGVCTLGRAMAPDTRLASHFYSIDERHDEKVV